MIHFILLLIVLLIQPAAYADIYKCTDANGVVKFSDRPCGDNAKVIVKGTADDRSQPDEKDTNSSLSSVMIDGSLTKEQVYEKLKAHSRSLGGQVFKDESFAGCRERPRVMSNSIFYNEVTCFWGSRSSKNFENYTMTIKYSRGVKPDGQLVFRPKEITYYYKNYPHDPESMKKIKNFRRAFHGTWRDDDAM
jgi:hypothetical protein